MLNLSKKTVLFGLGAILILSIVLRYPLVDHERFQADSYFIHYLSQSIVDSGYARWTYHPLSYIGLYPLSYPSGVPFVVSEFSMLSGVTVEVCTLIFGAILGALFALGMFFLAREFINRSEFVLFAVLIVTLGPRFVDTTYWVGSARGPLVVIMLLGVAAFIRSGNCNQKPLAVIGSLFIIASLTMHHMAILFAVFGFAYVLSVFGGRYLDRKMGKKRIMNLGIYCAILAAILLGAFVFFDFFSDSILRNFAVDDYIFDFESDVATAFANMAASYVHQMGFALLFAVIYAVSLLRGGIIGTKRIFPVVLLVSFLPLLGSALYLSMLLLPFVAILAALWFTDIFRTGSHRRIKRITLAALVISSLVLPVWSTAWWNGNDYITGDKVELDDGSFSDMTYLNAAYAGVYGFANSEILVSQFCAYSGINFVRTGVYSAINGDITREDISGGLSVSDADFPVNLYSWFEFDKDIHLYYAIRGVSTQGLSYLQGTDEYSEFAREYFSIRQHILVVVDNRWSDSFVGRWGILSSPLLDELRTAEWTSSLDSSFVINPLDSYTVYQSERITQYMVEIPG